MNSYHAVYVHWIGPVPWSWFKERGQSSLCFPLRDEEKQDWSLGMASPVCLVGQFSGRWAPCLPRQALYHRRRAGDALDDGAGWRATDGVKDVKRVWKNTLHAIFHRIYLEGGKNEIFPYYLSILIFCFKPRFDIFGNICFLSVRLIRGFTPLTHLYSSVIHQLVV